MAYLYIYSDGSEVKLKFPAYVTSFSDSFKASSVDEALPFNIDPLRIFSNTVRTINVSFDIVSENFSQADENLYNISLLSSFIYGTSLNTANKKLKSSPVDLRIFYYNLIRRFSTEKYDGNPYNNGLKCFFYSFDFKPEYESGFFTDSSTETIYPKLVKLSLTLGVDHEGADFRPRLVSGQSGAIVFSGFPYATNKSLRQNNLLNTKATTQNTPAPSQAETAATAAAAAAAQQAANSGQTQATPAGTPSPSAPAAPPAPPGAGAASE